MQVSLVALRRGPQVVLTVPGKTSDCTKLAGEAKYARDADMSPRVCEMYTKCVHHYYLHCARGVPHLPI
jgi:hypothetical protein